MISKQRKNNRQWFFQMRRKIKTSGFPISLHVLIASSARVCLESRVVHRLTILLALQRSMLRIRARNMERKTESSLQSKIRSRVGTQRATLWCLRKISVLVVNNLRKQSLNILGKSPYHLIHNSIQWIIINILKIQTIIKLNRIMWVLKTG